ncbi:F-box/FBD/LRR-repeat protein At4g00160-like [Salvia hispanica]|uniref:F-box/FBD/LRR-repeat protein At4g00160-like n=1 Tax=Salvia hispanica TaxID=49212 RepID=UPI002009025A|nr:F-box/FBD/LRR-repeat protein At4g00160-like [Salvia hispanica]
MESNQPAGAAQLIPDGQICKNPKGQICKNQTDNPARRSKRKRISELPDDVIINILSFLPLRDAVSTGLLSSRWLDLWKYTPNLDFFDTDYIYREKSDTEHGSWDVGTCKHVKMVNSVLESHQALFLKQFRLHFYANKSAQSVVTKWLGFVWSRQVESLDLNFRCEMLNYQVVLEDLLGEMRPMKYLQNLSLTLMQLRGEDISLFLKNCPFLRKLRIEESFLTSDVRISGATLALEDLHISGCIFSESFIINISAPNLSIVSVDARPGQLRFKNVPRLADACFLIQDPSYTMHHFTSALSCLTSQLQKLTLHGAVDNLLGKGFPRLPNLKELNVGDHTCLLPFTYVISACPRLQCFTITCFAEDDTTYCERDKELTFKGSCAANIIQSLTYAFDSRDVYFLKIKWPKHHVWVFKNVIITITINITIIKTVRSPYLLPSQTAPLASSRLRSLLSRDAESRSRPMTMVCKV